MHIETRRQQRRRRMLKNYDDLHVRNQSIRVTTLTENGTHDVKGAATVADCGISIELVIRGERAHRRWN